PEGDARIERAWAAGWAGLARRSGNRAVAGSPAPRRGAAEKTRRPAGRRNASHLAGGGGAGKHRVGGGAAPAGKGGGRRGGGRWGGVRDDCRKARPRPPGRQARTLTSCEPELRPLFLCGGDRWLASSSLPHRFPST